MSKWEYLIQKRLEFESSRARTEKLSNTNGLLSFFFFENAFFADNFLLFGKILGRIYAFYFQLCQN